jgi:hypothetical protein
MRKLWPIGLSLLLVPVAYLTLPIEDRAAILAKACDAGLPNLSRPAAISPETLGCTIVGERRTFSGIVFSSDHGSSIALARSETDPIALWFDRSFPALARQIDKSERQYCVRAASVSLTGWQTVGSGSFGEMGFAKRQIFVDQVAVAGPLPQSEINKIGKDRSWCRDEGEVD